MKRIWKNALCMLFHFVIKDARYIKDPKCFWAEASDKSSLTLLYGKLKNYGKFNGMPVVQLLAPREWW